MFSVHITFRSELCLFSLCALQGCKSFCSLRMGVTYLRFCGVSSAVLSAALSLFAGQLVGKHYPMTVVSALCYITISLAGVCAAEILMRSMTDPALQNGLPAGAAVMVAPRGSA